MAACNKNCINVNSWGAACSKNCFSLTWCVVYSGLQQKLLQSQVIAYSRLQQKTPHLVLHNSLCGRLYYQHPFALQMAFKRHYTLNKKESSFLGHHWWVGLWYHHLILLLLPRDCHVSAAIWPNKLKVLLLGSTTWICKCVNKVTMNWDVAVLESLNTAKKFTWTGTFFSALSHHYFTSNNVYLLKNKEKLLFIVVWPFESSFATFNFIVLYYLCKRNKNRIICHICK